MKRTNAVGLSLLLMTIGLSLASCSAAEDTAETEASSVSALTPPGQCTRAEAKDPLIAQLVKDSWVVGYPLTRLSVAADGSVVGTNAPDVIAGNLDVINSLPEARDSLARAVAEFSGLPDYQMGGIGDDTEACPAVPMWTPSGVVTIATTANQVFASGERGDSWRDVHQALGKECPLVKRIANRDVIDPPGDGSTNLPTSSTVSSYGVTANAFGLCPEGTAVGTFCKLSYATGVNYTGRTCQYYYGKLRCLVY